MPGCRGCASRAPVSLHSQWGIPTVTWQKWQTLCSYRAWFHAPSDLCPFTQNIALLSAEEEGDRQRKKTMQFGLSCSAANTPWGCSHSTKSSLIFEHSLIWLLANYKVALRQTSHESFITALNCMWSEFRFRTEMCWSPNMWLCLEDRFWLRSTWLRGREWGQPHTAFQQHGPLAMLGMSTSLEYSNCAYHAHNLKRCHKLVSTVSVHFWMFFHQKITIAHLTQLFPWQSPG